MTPRYRRLAEIRLAEVAGDGVVLHLGSRRYFTVSETGLTVLQALDEPRTLDELVASVIEAYDVTPEEAAATIAAFLRECEAAAVIATVDDP